MNGLHEERDRQSLGREMRRLADALSRLVRDHLDLARAELRAEAKRYAVDAALGVAAAPLLLAGYLLLNVAVALALAGWIGLPWAFALVGLLNVLVGGVLGGIAAARIRDRERPLPETTEELERHRLLFEQVRQDLRSERGPLPPSSVRPYAPNGNGGNGGIEGERK